MDGGKRVGVMASGGLSHIMIDEEVDQQALDALKAKDVHGLYALPRDLLVGGTSEILNWVALDGAVGPLPMTLGSTTSLAIVPSRARGVRWPSPTGSNWLFSE